ncbi:MAG: hypothetical protein ACI8W8_004889 [Rhodothermales bacterium]|jgi:hypothetical protein
MGQCRQKTAGKVHDSAALAKLAPLAHSYPMTRLIIGNRNYSSWSLRAWLYMRVSGLEFSVERVPLYVAGSRRRLLALSPAAKVPVLLDGDFVVWDS